MIESITMFKFIFVASCIVVVAVGTPLLIDFFSKHEITINKIVKGYNYVNVTNYEPASQCCAALVEGSLDLLTPVNQCGRTESDGPHVVVDFTLDQSQWDKVIDSPSYSRLAVEVLYGMWKQVPNFVDFTGYFVTCKACLEENSSLATISPVLGLYGQYVLIIEPVDRTSSNKYNYLRFISLVHCAQAPVHGLPTATFLLHSNRKAPISHYNGSFSSYLPVENNKLYLFNPHHIIIIDKPTLLNTMKSYIVHSYKQALVPYSPVIDLSRQLIVGEIQRTTYPAPYPFIQEEHELRGYVLKPPKKTQFLKFSKDLVASVHFDKLLNNSVVNTCCYETERTVGQAFGRVGKWIFSTYLHFKGVAILYEDHTTTLSEPLPVNAQLQVGYTCCELGHHDVNLMPFAEMKCRVWYQKGDQLTHNLGKFMKNFYHPAVSGHKYINTPIFDRCLISALAVRSEPFAEVVCVCGSNQVHGPVTKRLHNTLSEAQIQRIVSELPDSIKDRLEPDPFFISPEWLVIAYSNSDFVCAELTGSKKTLTAKIRLVANISCLKGTPEYIKGMKPYLTKAGQTIVIRPLVRFSDENKLVCCLRHYDIKNVPYKNKKIEFGSQIWNVKEKSPFPNLALILLNDNTPSVVLGETPESSLAIDFYQTPKLRFAYNCSQRIDGITLKSLASSYGLDLSPKEILTPELFVDRNNQMADAVFFVSRSRLGINRFVDDFNLEGDYMRPENDHSFILNPLTSSTIPQIQFYLPNIHSQAIGKAEVHELWVILQIIQTCISREVSYLLCVFDSVETYETYLVLSSLFKSPKVILQSDFIILPKDIIQKPEESGELVNILRSNLLENIPGVRPILLDINKWFYAPELAPIKEKVLMMVSEQLVTISAVESELAETLKQDLYTWVLPLTKQFYDFSKEPPFSDANASESEDSESDEVFCHKECVEAILSTMNRQYVITDDPELIEYPGLKYFAWNEKYSTMYTANLCIHELLRNPAVIDGRWIVRYVLEEEKFWVFNSFRQ